MQASLADTESSGGMKRTVEAALFPEEADFPIRVASDEADDDCFFLTALESIDTSKLYAGELFFQRCKLCKLVGTYPVSDRPA